MEAKTQLDIKIRKLKDSDDLEQITLMIRSAYKALLDKGFRYWGTFQTKEDTAKRFAYGHPFIAELDGKIIGTITLREDHTGWEESPWYDKEEVCFFSQFAVAPEYQKSGVGSQMMNFIESFAKELGFQEIALDTCEDAKGLIDYYKARGYRFVEYVQWDPDMVNYRSVVLSKSFKINP